MNKSQVIIINCYQCMWPYFYAINLRTKLFNQVFLTFWTKYFFANLLSSYKNNPTPSEAEGLLWVDASLR